MRRNCKFQMNQALLSGILMGCSALLLKNTLEPTGALLHLLCFAQGAAVALQGVGLLYGCPKTRPLFDKFHAFKRRLLGSRASE